MTIFGQYELFLQRCGLALDTLHSISKSILFAHVVSIFTTGWKSSTLGLDHFSGVSLVRAQIFLSSSVEFFTHQVQVPIPLSLSHDQLFFLTVPLQACKSGLKLAKIFRNTPMPLWWSRIDRLSSRLLTSGSLPNDFIAAVDRGSGKALWTDSNTGVVDGLTGGRHITYALLNGNTLWALDQKMGSTFWTFPSQSLYPCSETAWPTSRATMAVSTCSTHFLAESFARSPTGINSFSPLYSRRWGALLRECRQPVRVCFAAALSRRLAGRTRSPDAATPASL